jgi:hypothetical protein
VIAPRAATLGDEEPESELLLIAEIDQGQEGRRCQIVLVLVFLIRVRDRTLSQHVSVPHSNPSSHDIGPLALCNFIPCLLAPRRVPAWRRELISSFPVWTIPAALFFAYLAWRMFLA